MKLFRWGARGAEKAGALDHEGSMRDLSSVVADITPELLAPESLAMLRGVDLRALPTIAGSPRIGPCVARISQLVCTGLNYSGHIAEIKATAPGEPALFLKSVSAISGPYDDIVLPPGSRRTDWEVELGIVIGTRASRVSERAALEHVAGYCVANDVSEREYQFERGEPSPPKGKSADTFAPLGPYLVTSDEVTDPQSLDLFCDVSGDRMQTGSTAEMIFSCAYLVSYMSHFLTLQPGDILLTGTPSGTGFAQKPPRFLRAGDTLRLGISGLGEQRMRVIARQ